MTTSTYNELLVTEAARLVEKLGTELLSGLREDIERSEGDESLELSAIIAEVEELRGTFRFLAPRPENVRASLDFFGSLRDCFAGFESWALLDAARVMVDAA